MLTDVEDCLVTGYVSVIMKSADASISMTAAGETTLIRAVVDGVSYADTGAPSVDVSGTTVSFSGELTSESGTPSAAEINVDCG
jgi:hypothetical protein